MNKRVLAISQRLVASLKYSGKKNSNMAIWVLSNRGFTVHISLFFIECLGLVKHNVLRNESRKESST